MSNDYLSQQPPSCTFKEETEGDKIAWIDKGRPGHEIDESDLRSLSSDEYTYDYVPDAKISELSDYSDKPAKMALAYIYDEHRKREKPIADFDTIASIDDNDHVTLTSYGYARVDYCGEGRNNTSPFAVGDEVIVCFEYQDINKPVVVGFKDSPKGCQFLFKVTRDDGAVMNQSYTITFTAKNSSGVELTVIRTYSGDGYWTLDIAEGIPDDGVMVFFNCDDSILTKYPYKYKSADLNAIDDLIFPDIYDAAAPYWKEDDTQISPTYTPMYACEEALTETGRDPSGYFADGKWRYFLYLTANFFTLSKTIYSSIPYVVNFNIYTRNAYNSATWIGGCYFSFQFGVDYTVESNCGTVNLSCGYHTVNSQLTSIEFGGQMAGETHQLTITWHKNPLYPDDINLCLDSGNYSISGDYDY